MAVDVEHRNEDQDERFERARCGFVVQQLTHGEEARILAVDLAGVNPALHEQYGQVAFERLSRCQRTGARDREHEHRPPFRCAPELGAANGVLPTSFVRGTQTPDFVIAPGALKLGLLGDGC